ncbi:MAG: hypothetical protein KatS3mg003_1656 [Candidatus Nitrosocaldaceae archaeon]|nr:MAG: hypothetical protein KatS3mg003_1656 [Candidatus Nitrosocaldaceae archaeon]
MDDDPNTQEDETGMYLLDIPILSNTGVYVYEILPEGRIQTYPEFSNGHWLDNLSPGDVI